MTKWIKKLAINWGVGYVKDYLTVEKIKGYIASGATWLLSLVTKKTEVNWDKVADALIASGEQIKGLGEDVRDGVISTDEAGKRAEGIIAALGAIPVTDEMIHGALDKGGEWLKEKL